ncbi:uncharacterized protein [Miscanthus floridulus]|uniref:uncharacterized protein n=1 Tax=Miscanthus floridulus TaxID=154761 RepID=UPI00345801C0
MSLYDQQVPSWPFDAWGIDVIGPVDPPSSGGHRFILSCNWTTSPSGQRQYHCVGQNAQVHGQVQDKVELLHWLLSLGKRDDRGCSTRRSDKILKKTVNKYRRDWHDRLFEALWAYRVTLPSLRVAIHDGLTQDEQVRLRFQELDTLEERRLDAVQELELYRQNMARAYDKLVKRRVFRKGELVLVLRRPIVVTHKTKGKFEPKWEGPSFRYNREP